MNHKNTGIRVDREAMKDLREAGICAESKVDKDQGEVRL